MKVKEFVEKFKKACTLTQVRNAKNFTFNNKIAHKTALSPANNDDKLDVALEITDKCSIIYTSN
ncbi:hypothetical protein BX661DRAFT_184557 [Kickxella alabastrina]|uniref:uncharacterized protein n=1 Tax=Kickxella alabastrina TaxID=61397 RepID=UPI00221E5FDF|nr:uncharacterized protein BX661DRAFT_184557 [Kickxella alabastrina]KAI7825442.1 hypothetical protein BX661DRAFT_184557 [Kickxella alabastrina]